MVDGAASTEAVAPIASSADASTDFHEDAVTIAEKASMAAAHVSAARLHATKAAAAAAAAAEAEAEASPPQPASAIDDVAAAAVHEGEPVAAGWRSFIVIGNAHLYDCKTVNKRIDDMNCGFVDDEVVPENGACMHSPLTRDGRAAAGAHEPRQRASISF